MHNAHDMELGDRLGLAGLIVASIGIGTMYLWPTKKWIGRVAQRSEMGAAPFVFG